MLVNCWKVFAPSMRAASYWSAGMFCRMPVTCMMVYGMPTHRLTTMTSTRAQVTFSRKGRRWLIQPALSSILFTMPSGCTIERTTIRETNCGTAIVMDRQPRQRPLNLMVGRLMMSATIVPRKKFRKVAKNAQISVQSSTLPNCLPMTDEESKMAMKFFRPTQSNRTR